MNNFNFNLFKYYYYVAYYQGFTNASKELNVAQSALSYNVKTLEEQLNMQLIIRGRKKFELTDEGHNLFEILKTVFNSLEHNITQFHDNNIIYSELTIGVRHSLSDFVFKDAITEILQLIPNLHINIKLYSKLDVQQYTDEYDLVIDYMEYINLIPNTNTKKICDINNIFVCGKELYNEYAEVTSVKDLSNAKFISMNPNKKNGKFQQMCFNYGISFTDVISINDSVLCKKLIKGNTGIGFINEETVKEELINGEIKKINITEDFFDDTVVIAYKNNSKIDLIKKFIKVLEKQYKE